MEQYITIHVSLNNILRNMLLDNFITGQVLQIYLYKPR